MIATSTYSQRDPRWASIRKGKTTQTIGKYGCTITSLCNLINSFGYDETPNTVNEKLTANNGYIGALLVWSAPQKIWPKIKFVWRGYNYDNVKVAYYVYFKKTPVLVEVNGAKIGGSRHWVLFVGDGKMVDPWTGSVSSTSTYPLTGFSLYDKV